MSCDYYKIDPDKGSRYAATFLLLYIYKGDLQISTEKVGDDYQLRPAIELLLEKNHITIEGDTYLLQESGKHKAIQFEERYSTLLTYLDIFGFVDLEQGEFAYASYNECSTEEAWNHLKNEPRWSDLRVAMLDHLDGDSTEIVYAQMLIEGHYHPQVEHWQQCLMRGKWWREITSLCDSAIQMEDLGYIQQKEKITGEQVLDTIYDQAILILKSLYPDDLEIQSNLNSWYNTEASVNSKPSLIQTSSTPPWVKPWIL